MFPFPETGAWGLMGPGACGPDGCEPPSALAGPDGGRMVGSELVFSAVERSCQRRGPGPQCLGGRETLTTPRGHRALWAEGGGGGTGCRPWPPVALDLTRLPSGWGGGQQPWGHPELGGGRWPLLALPFSAGPPPLPAPKDTQGGPSPLGEMPSPPGRVSIPLRARRLRDDGGTGAWGHRRGPRSGAWVLSQTPVSLLCSHRLACRGVLQTLGQPVIELGGPCVGLL